MNRMGSFHYHAICRKQSKHNNRYFGGLAVLIKDKLKPYIKMLNNTNPDYQWVLLQKNYFGFTEDLNICLVYFPPSCSAYTQRLDQDILDCIENDISTFQKQGKILLCGDFNARVSSEPDFIANDSSKFIPVNTDYTIDKELLTRKNQDKVLDTRGKDLLDLCISNQLRFLNGRVLGDMFGTYTCHTPNGSSTVDYVILSESILDQILYFKVSDFIPTLSDTHCKLEWEILATYKQENLFQDKNTHPLSPNFKWDDDSANNFLMALGSADIQTQLHNLNNKTTHNSQISVDDTCQELNNPKLYWNLINDLKDTKKHDENYSTIDSSTWFSHFQNLNTLQDKFKARLEELQKQLDKLETVKCFNELDISIKDTEISKALAKLKPNKSPGMDNISNNMLKHGQSILLPILKKLFNTCLSSGINPKCWSDGYISTIHKSSDITNPNNYRGITVTSAIGKVFNSVLNSRFDDFLLKHKLIHECQLGFTKKARTSDHMFIIKCIFDKYCNSKDGRVYACFVDFQKAFDTVIHIGIKLKLLSAGVGTSFYNVIKHMYESSKSCVKIQSRVTDFFQIKLGVKQGDNLSPNLFKLFINDLPEYLKESEDPVILNEKPVNCLLYADDLVLLSTSAKGLQTRLNNLEKYCKDWCLSIRGGLLELLRSQS
ncbi:uncharacterized protein LOC134722974 [Mytilus trossulus]|uniref:uncharacterized protein LOC134722974 n=1 Tax=Mytilus trossulus TaxID=6551 RepID=UPI00300412B1